EINRDFKQIIEKKLSSKIKEKKRRDFHNLLMFLWKNEKENNLKFNFKLAKRKGYTVISSIDDRKNVAFDLLILDRISDEAELVRLLEKKISENNIQNFLKSIQDGENKKIDNFVVILTQKSEKIEKILMDYNEKYSNRILFVEWDNFYNNSSLIKELLSGDQVISKNILKKVGDLDKFL
ncbi:MAG: hypothetical protein ACTSSI_18220, partial [Candidatus Helarchaeota archaeon]